MAITLATARPTLAQDATADGPEPEDPTVLAIRESNPTTPAELVNAIEVMMNLGRSEEASAYLKKILAAKPNHAALAGLQREFGSGLFIRMSRDQQLQPEAKQLADAVLDAARRYVGDPRRLQQLINQLEDADPDARRAALVDLGDAGAAAIGPLLSVLADPSRAGQHPGARRALVELGQPAVEPLIGVLDAPDERLRIQAIDVLGRLRASRATAYLVRPALSQKVGPDERRVARAALSRIVGVVPLEWEAEYLLKREAANFLNGAPTLKPDHNQRVELWHWDAQMSASLPRRLLAADAALVVAARLASDLYALVPENRDYRRLYLATHLESAKVAAGLDQPLPGGDGSARALAAAAGVDAVEDVLEWATSAGRLPAAIGAAEVLGDIGNPALLRSSAGRTRTLVRALRHSNRRLRFAAAEATIRIDSSEPYPGSSHLPEALGYFISTVGTRRALIGHPRPEHGQTLVGMLDEMGFEAETAYTGKQFLKTVFASADYELMLISDAVDRPNVNELIQQLRRDPRAAALPLGLMGRPENMDRNRRLAALDPLTEAFPQPYDETALRFQLRRLLSLAGRNLLTVEERRRQAEKSLEWLALLAEHPGRYPFYDLVRLDPAIGSALFVPELSEKAARVLGLLGTPGAQRALVMLASRNARPLAHRLAAAQAFAATVSSRGLLLTSQEILLQYDRYNQSATSDKGTQDVLGSILDTIERKKQ